MLLVGAAQGCSLSLYLAPYLVQRGQEDLVHMHIVLVIGLCIDIVGGGLLEVVGKVLQ